MDRNGTAKALAADLKRAEERANREGWIDADDFDREMKDSNMLIFGDLRNIMDRTAKIQICHHKTGFYEDYKKIEDVPHDYDNRSVFGIGLVRSEYLGKDALNTGRYAYAIEVRLI